MFKDKVMQLARQGKISLEEDSATTNAITIESGHFNDNKDSCNVVHGDNTTSNEDTLFKKKDFFNADDCMSTISFTDEDLLLGSKPHNHSLFIAGYVHEQKVNGILIDGGSAVNILPLRILKELGMPHDPRLQSKRTKDCRHYKDATDYEGHVVPFTWYQCFKNYHKGIVEKLLGDNKSFTEAESHFVDAKYYIEDDKNGKEIDLKQPSKPPLKEFVPSTQEEEGRHEALAIDEKGFDLRPSSSLLKPDTN
ncbi:UNVERIFIED_CONTAM: hypothetical protein Scaly_2783400 [Sesamum calycinum]|uniref:Uncharacterized protein n=1 Tax=Sesamum calycinum TaxID=2727403 RepID=A0AAW2IWN1_9LAMI